MTDKNHKQDCTTTVKPSSRGQTPVSLHQIQPGPGMIQAHSGYAISPEVVHHPSPHLSYRMIQPTFTLPHHLTIAAPGTRPVSISNDLGPPIFMPSLNLGVPKSSIHSSVASKHNKGPSPAVATALLATSHDGISSPNVITSYPNLVAHAGAPFPAPGVFHHSQPISFPPQVLPPPESKIQSSKVGVLPINSVRKIKQETGTSKTGSMHPVTQSVSSPIPNAFSPNNLIGVSSSMGMGPPVNSSGMGVGPTVNMISLVKPTVSKSTSDANVVELAVSAPSGHVTYATPTSHYQPGLMQHVPVGGVSKGGASNRTGKGGDVTFVTLASGVAGGTTLVCTEGLSPPVPRITTPSTASNSSVTSFISSFDERTERSQPQYLPNHQSTDNSHNESTIHFDTGLDPHIPWPEAVSKNIIIPAPNLTGKDIANLTSSGASSPLPQNETPVNDIHWQSTERGYTDSTTSLDQLPIATHPGSPPLVIQNDTSFSQSGSNIGSMGLSSSPRPSILRKRTFDGNRSTDSLSSPLSSPGYHHLSRRNSRSGTMTNEHAIPIENHLLRDVGVDMSSPRKRPRKQHFDSINDHCYPHQPHSQEDDLVSHSHTNVTTHHSMLANERLPGPLPHKSKGNFQGMEVHPSMKVEKQLEIIYLSQLRKSPIPIIQLCKRTRRTPYNHFRRHADIKHKEDTKVATHDICNQESTWLRSSGWKILHFNSQLNRMEDLDTDILDVTRGLQVACRGVLDTVSSQDLNDKHQKFIEEVLQGNIERIRRSRLHIQETRDKMFKILNANSKAVDIMKKFATQPPVQLSVTTTAVSTSNT